jgi:preprotein translocase subunit SecG
MTAPARILYVLENKNTVFIKQIPLFLIKSQVMIKFLYYLTVLLFLLFFFISFFKSYVNYQNDNF